MAAARIDVVPTGSALGADVKGLNLSEPLSKEARSTVLEAWKNHLVLRFRDQSLTDDQLTEFSKVFGVLDKAPIAAAKIAVGGADREIHDWQNEYVTIISNVVENGKAIGGLGNYESAWHSDMTYNQTPPIGSLLFALEVPPSGGDTGFANMYAAYEAMPAALRQRIAGLTCKHDSSYDSAGLLRRGHKEVVDPREAPGAVHPLAHVHPVTKRTSLYLGRRRNASIVGLPLQESEALLDELWSYATRPDFTWYQVWKPGDLVLWDNRCTLHRRDSFDAATRRVMHRTQIGSQFAAAPAH